MEQMIFACGTAVIIAVLAYDTARRYLSVLASRVEHTSKCTHEITNLRTAVAELQKLNLKRSDDIRNLSQSTARDTQGLRDQLAEVGGHFQKRTASLAGIEHMQQKLELAFNTNTKSFFGECEKLDFRLQKLEQQPAVDSSVVEQWLKDHPLTTFINTQEKWNGEQDTILGKLVKESRERFKDHETRLTKLDQKIDDKSAAAKTVGGTYNGRNL